MEHKKRPLGDICLLAEDLLDPFNDYLLEFHQEDQKDGPISLHADMLTAQSLTIPLPTDLKPGPVHIKIYPYRFGSITFKGFAQVNFGRVGGTNIKIPSGTTFG